MNKDAKFVRFSFPDSGFGSDRDLVRDLINKHKLVVGQVYQVKRVKEGSWHTDVWLKDFPDVAFNSVHFEDANESTLDGNI